VLACFDVQPLTAERIPEAFPLVASLDQDITAQQWSDYASAFVAPSGQGEGCGIMTLQDPQRHIVGLSVYSIRPDLHRGRLLVIENFAVVSLIKVQQAASTLLAAMEDLARERGCACLSVSLLDRRIRRSPNHPRSQAGRIFTGAGFRLDLARLGKCFGPIAVEGRRLDGVNGPTEGVETRS